MEITVCCLQMPSLDVPVPPTPFEAALLGHTPFAAAAVLDPTSEGSQVSQETPGTTPGHSYVRLPYTLPACYMFHCPLPMHAPARSPAGALPVKLPCCLIEHWQ